MQNISTLISSISETYLNNLGSLKTITKKVRSSSEDYYQKYKALKKDFLKKRRELKTKTAEYEYTTKENLLENQVVKGEIKEYRLERKLFKEKAKIEISEEKQDINDIAEILDSLVQDVNIFEGLENDDAIIVSEALNSHLKEKTNYESGLITLENESESKENNNDFLVEKMRIIVNDLYDRKKISLMDIKFLDNKVFSFGKKCVILNTKDEKIYGNLIFKYFNTIKFTYYFLYSCN